MRRSNRRVCGGRSRSRALRSGSRAARGPARPGGDLVRSGDRRVYQVVSPDCRTSARRASLRPRGRSGAVRRRGRWAADPHRATGSRDTPRDAATTRGPSRHWSPCVGEYAPSKGRDGCRPIWCGRVAAHRVAAACRPTRPSAVGQRRRNLRRRRRLRRRRPRRRWKLRWRRTRRRGRRPRRCVLSVTRPHDEPHRRIAARRPVTSSAARRPAGCRRRRRAWLWGTSSAGRRTRAGSGRRPSAGGRTAGPPGAWPGRGRPHRT